jgi:hypothetical protein
MRTLRLVVVDTSAAEKIVALPGIAPLLLKMV